MRSAVLYGPHDFRIEEFPTPPIGEKECLIQVKACGVCHSEQHQWLNKIPDIDYPRRIGHEAAGEVVKIGSKVKTFCPGDRVALWIDSKGYSEQVAAGEDRMFKISPGIAFEEALAEPIGCTINGIVRTKIQPGDTVALVGTGFMGLMLLQEIKLQGAALIIAIDVRDDMLQIALQLGADAVINPANENVEKRIDELTGKKKVDISFEIGGNDSTLNTAAVICRMEGKLVIFGYHPGARTIKDLGYWNWMAFEIINAHFRDLQTILKGSQRGIELLNAGKINLKPLITHKYSLEKIEEAFMTAQKKPQGFVKSVIIM
jgi:2-desacetyl-2-hydroxyethyl bacteriochlorophyllide A dehydrogenase